MTIYGSDLSHYDWTRGSVNVSAFHSAGIQFMTHKAGGDSQDAKFADWWSRAKGVGGLLAGAYWVLYPGSPVARADAFLARLDAAAGGWRDRPFILQVDCEKWGGNQATVPPVADIRSFCQRLVAKTAGKLRPIVYGPKWVYGDALTGLGFPLWASSYVTGAGPFGNLYPGDQSSKWAAYSGQTPAILQYTSSATIAGQLTCDANAYRGTIQQLTALVAPGFVEADVSLDANDKAWLTHLAEQIRDQTRDAILTGTRFDWTADDPKDPNSYRRNLVELVGDPWANLMRGTTAGGDPLPPASTDARILAALAVENAETAPSAAENARAVVEALSAGTPDRIAATLLAVPGVDWSAVAQILNAARQ